MNESMEPYDYVTEDDYDRQRPHRLLPDYMLENEEYILRYIGSKDPGPFLAMDYVVCTKGIARQGRLSRMFSKLTEVHFMPVPLDGPPTSKNILSVQMGGDGIVYSPSIIAMPERGYFLDDVPRLDVIEFIQAVKPIERTQSYSSGS